MAEVEARKDRSCAYEGAYDPVKGRDLEAAAHSYAFWEMRGQYLKNEELMSRRRVGSDFVSRLSHRS